MTEVKGDVAAYLNAANQTMQTQFAQVNKDLEVLDLMLADRQDQLARSLWLTVAAVALGVAAPSISSWVFSGP